MNSRRLLTILLVGMLLSACAQFTPYRTQTLTESPTESQPKVIDCAVDKNTEKGGRKLCEDSKSKKGGRKRCEDPISAKSADCHAIQHRFYQTKDGEVDGDYYLSFVEFDDQGWFADRKQMEALFALLKKLEDENEADATNGHTLVYVYAHGWKHNASSCDNNVVCFSRLLERHDLTEKAIAVFSGQTKDVRVRKVVGVYLGWRGLPFGSVLNNLSFWSRKDAAARVGRGGVLELLTRLKDYQESRQKDYRESKKKAATVPLGFHTQLVITGHSFGGLVIYEALSHALMERAAKTKKYPDGAIQYDVAESFGDFVMLINPAFEGSLYEPLFHIATNRCYDTAQHPVTMIVTSKADSATGKAFPIGRRLSTLLQHKKSSEQAESMRQTIGHNDRYVTHNLTADTSSEEEDKDPKWRDCGCRYLTPTSEKSLEELVGPILETIIGTAIDPASQDNFYGLGVCLKPGQCEDKTDPPKKKVIRTYAPNYPYLVVETNKNVITDHNAIYSDQFILFAQQFFVTHIVKGKPLPGSKGKRECRRKKGGLLPSEQSCWLGVKGKSCSVPTKMENR